MKKYIGIDIGGTAVKAGIIDSSGKIIKKITKKANINNYQIPLLEIAKNTAAEIYQLALDRDFKLEGVAVSAAGQIDSQRGIVIGDNGHIPEWKGSNLKKAINSVTNLKVEAANDANCAALAERWLGNGRGYNNLIVYTIGTGIGAGIIIDGKLLSGNRGIAGELGHMIIEQQGRKCSCGNRGCFEQYGSMTALIKEIKAQKIIKRADPDGRLIFQEAKSGNKKVKKYLEQFINYHAAAIISLLHIFNPESVIIGGGVSAQKEYLIEPIDEIIRRKAMPAYLEGFSLKTAGLQNDAGMIGAVKFFIDQN
jgi:glucokinase